MMDLMLGVLVIVLGVIAVGLIVLAPVLSVWMLRGLWQSYLRLSVRQVAWLDRRLRHEIDHAQGLVETFEKAGWEEQARRGRLRLRRKLEAQERLSQSPFHKMDEESLQV